MSRSTVIAFAALLVGSFIGWQARYFPPDGPDGIQWKFNEAARRGDTRQMEQLVSAGADPLAIASAANGAITGVTPLLEASSAGEPEAVQFLIDKGAEVDRMVADACPLGAAEYRLQQAEATVRILRAHGATRLPGRREPRR